VTEKPDSETKRWFRWVATEQDVEPLPPDTEVRVEFDSGVELDARVDDILWSDAAIKGYYVTKESEEDPGWRPWDGGSKPPVAGEMCVAKLRSGSTTRRSGEMLRWLWTGTEGDIIAYKIEELTPGEGDPDPEESFLWKATVNAEPPLPGSVRVKVLLRGTEADYKWIGGELPVNSWGWSGLGENSDGDIVEYRVCSSIPGGWHPFSATKDSKRPCGFAEMVEIRTREGDIGRALAHKFVWTHNIRDRDKDVVAWRKIRRS